MNPQCACWHENFYLALRDYRRSTDWCKQPSQVEIDACVKAFELRSDEPEHSDNMPIAKAIQMSKLYGELLFGCRRGSEEHQEITELAIKFAR